VGEWVDAEQGEKEKTLVQRLYWQPRGPGKKNRCRYTCRGRTARRYGTEKTINTPKWRGTKNTLGFLIVLGERFAQSDKTLISYIEEKVKNYFDNIRNY
jgi:hypothetical protein